MYIAVSDNIIKITYRTAARGGPNHGHNEHTRKFEGLEIWAYSRTDPHRHGRQNTSPPLPGGGGGVITQLVLASFCKLCCTSWREAMTP